MELCPNCSKLIQDNTVKCPYCGEATNNDDVNKLIQQMEKRSYRNIFSVDNVLAVLGFIPIAVIAICVICFIGYVGYILIFD